MATFLGLFCTFLVILAVSNMSHVTAHGPEEFRVGDSEGWRQPPSDDIDIYSHWAKKHRFHVGDSLRFCYKNDSVVVVDKWGYYHCDTKNAASFYNDGNTLVNLAEPGPIYITSGNTDHCKKGQKFEINVIPLHPKSHTPPAIWAPAPAPSPSSNSGNSVSAAMLSVFWTLGVSLVGLVLISMA